ncbi:MAG: hypothetical protein ABI670_00210 [Chloroflexota bacterium]
MTQLYYDLAELIPDSLSAQDTRGLLIGVRDYFTGQQTQLPGKHEMDQALRRLATEHHTRPAVLFRMLRVVLQWPLASPGLFDVVVSLGPVDLMARLDKAIRRFSDVA